MAGHAAFGLNRFMLEDEGAALVHVAGEADGVLGSGGAKLRLAESAMGIVAIGALHEAFVDAMVHGHIELGLVLEMAAIAELGLFFREKEFRVLGVVDGMAVETVHIVVSMLGTLKIHLLLAGGVTFHALRDDGFGARAIEDEDFGFVGGVVNMRRTRAMAGFASLLGGAAARVAAGGEVGRVLPGGVFSVVAGLAGVRADELRRGTGGFLRSRGWIRLLRRSLRRSQAGRSREKKRGKARRERKCPCTVHIIHGQPRNPKLRVQICDCQSGRGKNLMRMKCYRNRKWCQQF